MKLVVQDTRTVPARPELLVVFGLQGEKPHAPGGVRVPPLALEAFQGEFRETRLTDALAGPAQRFLQVGLGKPGELDAERLRRAAAIAARKAEKVRAGTAVLWVEPALGELAGGPAAVGQALAEGALLGSYSFQRFKSKPKGPWLKTLYLCGRGAAFARGAEKGRILGEANRYARELQDAPANRMRPRDLVSAARELARRNSHTRVQVHGETGLERMGMGALLSVARGSEEPAFLIHLVHRPRQRPRGKVCLVGKGLTFDAGGISLKPSTKMEEMKYDMSGAAAVLGVFHALSRLQLSLEVHGLIPTSENLPDGRANKPGDLVTALNGLTIEVINTDAEGRLVLADALAYAEKRIRPELIVDLATLTGAVVTALGHELTGVLGNDQALIDELVRAGKKTGELVWPLPLLEQHKDHMKGSVGDLKNVNSGQGAGSSAGAAFLSYFVGETPWAHLDIAGTAWGAEERDYQGGPGGTGVGVRLLMEFLERRPERGEPRRKTRKKPVSRRRRSPA